MTQIKVTIVSTADLAGEVQEVVGVEDHLGVLILKVDPHQNLTLWPKSTNRSLMRHRKRLRKLKNKAQMPKQMKSIKFLKKTQLKQTVQR